MICRILCRIFYCWLLGFLLRLLVWFLLWLLFRLLIVFFLRLLAVALFRLLRSLLIVVLCSLLCVILRCMLCVFFFGLLLCFCNLCHYHFIFVLFCRLRLFSLIGSLLFRCVFCGLLVFSSSDNFFIISNFQRNFDIFFFYHTANRYLCLF